MLITYYEFGFRNKCTTICQVHRITGVFEKALEEKRICLDVTQAFDKVWHRGLEYKMEPKRLPKRIIQIQKSYI